MNANAQKEFIQPLHKQLYGRCQTNNPKFTEQTINSSQNVSSMNKSRYTRSVRHDLEPNTRPDQTQSISTYYGTFAFSEVLLTNQVQRLTYHTASLADERHICGVCSTVTNISPSVAYDHSTFACHLWAAIHLTCIQDRHENCHNSIGTPSHKIQTRGRRQETSTK